MSSADAPEPTSEHGCTGLLQRLPVGDDAEARQARRTLFLRWDIDTDGLLSPLDAAEGLTEALGPRVHAARSAISRAFHTAQEVDPVGGSFRSGSECLDFNQFRVFLAYVVRYLELWDLCSCDGMDADPKVSFADFEVVLPMLFLWRAQRLPLITQDAQAAFNEVDRSGGGAVPFDDFAHWALHQGLGDLEDASSADREEAMQILADRQPVDSPEGRKKVGSLSMEQILALSSTKVPQRRPASSGGIRRTSSSGHASGTTRASSSAGRRRGGSSNSVSPLDLGARSGSSSRQASRTPSRASSSPAGRAFRPTSRPPTAGRSARPFAAARKAAGQDERRSSVQGLQERPQLPPVSRPRTPKTCVSTPVGLVPRRSRSEVEVGGAGHVHPTADANSATEAADGLPVVRVDAEAVAEATAVGHGRLPRSRSCSGSVRASQPSVQDSQGASQQVTPSAAAAAEGPKSAGAQAAEPVAAGVATRGALHSASSQSLGKAKDPVKDQARDVVWARLLRHTYSTKMRFGGA